MTWQWVIVIGLVLWFILGLFFTAAWVMIKKGVPDNDDVPADDESVGVACSRDASTGIWSCEQIRDHHHHPATPPTWPGVSGTTEYKKMTWD